MQNTWKHFVITASFLLVLQHGQFSFACKHNFGYQRYKNLEGVGRADTQFFTGYNNIWYSEQILKSLQILSNIEKFKKNSII